MRILAFLLAISAAAFAQCTVDGTVVNSVSGAPIERAHVSIIAAGDTFLTDADSLGKWSIARIPCDSATVLVNRPGFLRTQQSIAKAAHDVRLKLVPQAVLAGRVVDEHGDPLFGAQVSLMTSRVINGVRGLQASTSEVTNDLGEYRFSGLAAGKYILCANSGGGPIVTGSRSYGDKCYPGSMPMDVTAGYESRIDFTLLPLTTVRVSGQILGQSDGRLTTVVLVPRTQIARMSMGLSAPVRPDGGFTIRNVPPSSYMALVTSGNRQTAIPVEIGSADIDLLHLHIEPGATVTGTVKPTAASAMDVQLVRDLATDGIAFSTSGVWTGDRTSFTFSDVPSGNYRVQLTPPTPFYVKSVTLGGRDISNSDFLAGPGAGNIEVVLADDGGTLEGDVSAPAWVLVQKDGVSSRNARTDASGHFKIDNLPPGDYKVYAWDDNSNVEYGNPEWMRQNSKGVAVSVTSGQTAQVRITRQTAPAE
jgi:Carboxypeptidase regulatory-like domain/Polysaccharide lyase family 4, domain II